MGGRPERPTDINQLAAQIVAESTQEARPDPQITVALSEPQLPNRIRLDVTVVEHFETYTGVAYVMPDGRINANRQGRVMKFTPAVQKAVEQAVRAYLVHLSQQRDVA